MFWYNCVLVLSLILVCQGQDDVVCQVGDDKSTEFNLNGAAGQCDKVCTAEVSALKKQVEQLAKEVAELKGATPALTVPPTTAAPDCGKCYAYKLLSEEKLDFAGAVAACQGLGYVLAQSFLRCNDEAEQQKIGRLAEGNKVYIGLRRPLTDTSIEAWRYTDGTVSTRSNTPWAVGKPNNWNNMNEACVEMYGESYPYYKLNDIVCNDLRFPFCQKKIC